MIIDKSKPDKKLAAACGLFCTSCAIYIATNEDIERLQRQAESLGLNLNDTKCQGCRSDKRNANCSKCFMLKCTQNKGIDFCVDCDDYPCLELKGFQSKMPHRIELWKDLDRIKSIGWEKWYVEKVDYYKCKQCETINSGWDIVCRKCGNKPSCDYIENNILEIEKRLK